MRAKKIVNQSSDFPVRRTGSYRHKKALCGGEWRYKYMVCTPHSEAGVHVPRVPLVQTPVNGRMNEP